MSWLASLSETYDNFYGGAYEQTGDRIVPVGFIEKKVLFTVFLDADGNFHGAARNEKKIQIPSSPQAVARTGGVSLDKPEKKTEKTPTPYPLCDELRYLAGDLSELVGLPFEAYFKSYIIKLREWCQTEDAPAALKLLLGYLERKTLANDLKTAGYITDKDFGSKSAREKLYKGMVEFQVYDSKKQDFIGIAEMPEVQKSWSKRLIDSMGKLGLCYASGETSSIVDIHPKLFEHMKLISSKDTERIFQYAGRFNTVKEALSVSYSVSEKAHNTLRWLINRQGNCIFTQKYNLYFVAWNKECYEIIHPHDDLVELMGTDTEVKIDTAEEYSKFIASKLSGFQRKPVYEPGRQVVLMGLESSSKGRMSINYYEEIGSKEYLERLQKWYQRCFWRISWYGKDNKYHIGVSTPSIEKMEKAVFDADFIKSARIKSKKEKSATKQIRHFYLNMLACISGGRHAPVGYTMTAYHRVLNPQSFRNRNGSWQRTDWIDCMGVTLAMLKSADTKEEYNVALNEKETDRSYLYGRLTAVADIIESRALYETDSDRMTNAARLFTVMQQRPATTWQNLEQKLSPYFGKLSAASRAWYNRMIDSIIELGDDLMGDNSPLSPRFIEGYHNQRYVLLSKKKEN